LGQAFEFVGFLFAHRGVPFHRYGEHPFVGGHGVQYRAPDRDGGGAAAEFGERPGFAAELEHLMPPISHPVKVKTTLPTVLTPVYSPVLVSPLQTTSFLVTVSKVATVSGLMLVVNFAFGPGPGSHSNANAFSVAGAVQTAVENLPFTPLATFTQRPNSGGFAVVNV